MYGDVAKMDKAEVCKTSITGSSPVVAFARMLPNTPGSGMRGCFILRQ